MENLPKVLVELTGGGSKLQSVMARIQATVGKSFVDDGWSRIDPTMREIRRRNLMACNWFVSLRKDLGYSTPKALDMLPKALRSSLNGEGWEPPPAEESWTVGS